MSDQLLPKSVPEGVLTGHMYASKKNVTFNPDVVSIKPPTLTNDLSWNQREDDNDEEESVSFEMKIRSCRTSEELDGICKELNEKIELLISEKKYTDKHALRLDELVKSLELVPEMKKILLKNQDKADKLKELDTERQRLQSMIDDFAKTKTSKTQPTSPTSTHSSLKKPHDWPYNQSNTPIDYQLEKSSGSPAEMMQVLTTDKGIQEVVNSFIQTREESSEICIFFNLKRAYKRINFIRSEVLDKIEKLVTMDKSLRISVCFREHNQHAQITAFLDHRTDFRSVGFTENRQDNANLVLNLDWRENSLRLLIIVNHLFYQDILASNTGVKEFFTQKEIFLTNVILENDPTYYYARTSDQIDPEPIYVRELSDVFSKSFLEMFINQNLKLFECSIFYNLKRSGIRSKQDFNLFKTRRLKEDKRWTDTLESLGRSRSQIVLNDLGQPFQRTITIQLTGNRFTDFGNNSMFEGQEIQKKLGGFIYDRLWASSHLANPKYLLEFLENAEVIDFFRQIKSIVQLYVDNFNDSQSFCKIKIASEFSGLCERRFPCIAREATYSVSEAATASNNREQENVMKAFTHFVYEKSNRDCIISDLRTVIIGFQEFLITEPIVFAKHNESLGASNLGKYGIRKFEMQHKCNAVCQKLNLSTLPQDKN